MSMNRNYLLDRNELSRILREQQKRYNKQHPDSPLNNEDLYSIALAYIDPKHYIRYQVLSSYFDPESMPDFIKRVEKNYLRNLKHKEKQFDEYAEVEEADNPFFYEHLFNYTDDESYDEEYDDDSSFFDNYMNGKYFCEQNKCAKDINRHYTYVKNPSQIFYTLARVLHLDEKELIQAFYDGECMDVTYYCKMYAYDIITYFFQKSGLAVTDLCEKLDVDYMKKSKVSQIIYGKQNMEFDDFIPLAYALGVPEDLIKSSGYRLAQRKDPFSYKAGYKACIEDFQDNPEEMGHYLDLVLLDYDEYESLKADSKPTAKNDEVATKLHLPTEATAIQDYFYNLGYRFSVNSDNSVNITFPNGEVRIAEEAEYSKFLDSLKNFAEFTLHTISKNS